MIDRMAFKGQASMFHLFDLVKGQDIFFFLLGKVRDDIVSGGHLVFLKKRIDDGIEILDAIIKGQPDKFLSLWDFILGEDAIGFLRCQGVVTRFFQGL